MEHLYGTVIRESKAVKVKGLRCRSEISSRQFTIVLSQQEKNQIQDLLIEGERILGAETIGQKKPLIVFEEKGISFKKTAKPNYY